MGKLVEITARRVTIGGKMYGQGGQYRFENAIAAQIVRNGQGKIARDLGKDDSDFQAQSTSNGVGKQEFLKMVAENASEIIDILDVEFQRRRFNEEGDSEDEQKSEEDAEKTKTEDTSQTQTEDDQDETSDDEEDENNESKAEATPIPERFPSKDKLEEAGFKTLEEIPRDKQKLLELGLSERSINAIEGRLFELLGE